MGVHSYYSLIGKGVGVDGKLKVVVHIINVRKIKRMRSSRAAIAVEVLSLIHI